VARLDGMARLTYSAIASLDGYVADQQGRFEWSAPDEEVHALVNQRARSIGTYLLGRRMYEVLLAWETMPAGPDEPQVIRDFTAAWHDTDKVVFSSTLDRVESARTRIERSFDPAAVQRLKATAERDLSVGGPHLAAAAFAAGLVDEVELYLNPLLVGGGTAALPPGIRLPLRLLAERRFGNGVVHLHYQVDR
jgi:dihydrofolate reductase